MIHAGQYFVAARFQRPRIEPGDEIVLANVAGAIDPAVLGRVLSNIDELPNLSEFVEIKNVGPDAAKLAGVELLLVNARHVKSLPGRKTDVADATWLAQLGAHIRRIPSTSRERTRAAEA